MARARFIRPEFFTDEKVAILSLEARLLFQALWCHSDLNGVFIWSLHQIKIQAFPFDDAIPMPVIDQSLMALVDCGMVGHFVSEGKHYGVVTNFNKYQPICGSEKKIGTKRPSVPDTLTTNDIPRHGTVPIECRARAASPSISPYSILHTPTPTPTHSEPLPVQLSQHGHPPVEPKPAKSAKPKKTPEAQCIARHEFRVKGKPANARAAIAEAIKRSSVEAVDQLMGQVDGVWASDLLKTIGLGQPAEIEPPFGSEMYYHREAVRIGLENAKTPEPGAEAQA